MSFRIPQPSPQSPSSTLLSQHTERTADPSGTGPHRCPTSSLIGIIVRAGSMAPKPWAPESLLCFPSCIPSRSSQPRPLVISSLWVVMSSSPCHAHVGSSSQKAPHLPLFTLSPSLFSKPCLSIHYLVIIPPPPLCSLPIHHCTKATPSPKSPIFPAREEG